jgi:hypothetical protein
VSQTQTGEFEDWGSPGSPSVCTVGLADGDLCDQLKTVLCAFHYLSYLYRVIW